MAGNDGKWGRSREEFSGASTGDKHKAASNPLGVRGVIGSTVVMALGCLGLLVQVSE